jgi:hypothetical protein
VYEGLLDAGPPPLTVAAADAALDVIDFMAAQVRGVDEIDVTADTRDRWRAHLRSYYQLLVPADRFWFANAPFTLAAIQTGWAQLNEQQRGLYRQAWAAALPAMLQLVDPVLQADQPQPLGEGSVAEQVVPQPAPTSPPPVDDEAAAQAALFDHQVNLQLLQNMSNMGTSNTIGLMRAYGNMS